VVLVAVTQQITQAITVAQAVVAASLHLVLVVLELPTKVLLVELVVP
jgi:hypothetical protein